MSGSPPLADAAARLRRTAACGAVVLAVVALHPARPGGAVGAGSPTAAVTAPAGRSQARLSRAVPLATGQPVRFEENRGQADPRVRYISRARDYTVALTDDEALLLVRKPGSPAGRGRLQASDMALLRMRLADGVPASRITASEAMPGQVYVADAAARGPLTPIDTFARVEYSDVYPGIDLVYYGKDDRLEFDFVVAPFADPARIGLFLEGAEHLTVTGDGDLSMRVGGAEVTLEKPLVYQERDGRRTGIPGAYVLSAGETSIVRFRLGRYDPSLPLVIDPAWMTVFGSTNEDWLSGFAVDSAGQPRVLGSTFDPATFPHTHHETGVLPPPTCFLTKLDAATGLTTYTVLFANTQNCGTLALSPAGIAYFTGFVYPNGFQNNQGTTVTAVDDSSGAPAISRFGVANYDSSGIGEGVDAIAVNSLGHVFLLGACRVVGPGDQPLELSGFNETADAAAGIFDEGCSAPRPGFAERTQPLLTVVDTSGTFLYGSFLSAGEFVGEYGLAADDADRAYIVGSQTEALAVTADAYRSACPAAGLRGFDLCGYLMLFDTTTTGPASLAYASYLWNTEDVETIAVRLGPAGDVYIASEGQVFDDFPSNRPADPSTWPYSLYPAFRDGIQLARFNRDANGTPSQFDFALVFDPSLGVAALAGHTARDELADLRLFPSGAPAIATIAHTQSLAPIGIVTTFAPGAERVGEVWTHNLGTRTPPGFGVGTGPGGHLLVAGQIDRTGAQDSDIFVEQIEAVDPGTNRPPTVTILEALSAHGNPLTLYAESPTGGALLQLNAIANDPDGDALTYAWSGPFIDGPVTTDFFIVSRLALGLGQTVTVTVDDGHGNVVSVSQVFNVVGTPFAGTSATPVDSTINGLVFNYAPLTITAAGIDAAGNAYLRSRLDQNPPIPSHLQAGSPPIYFDVSTDATLVFPVAICLDTRGMSFANPADVRLYQYQQAGGAWVDITAPGSPQGNQLCGQSDSLGTFAIFYPQVPSTAVQTIAGNGVREGANDGPGGNPLDDFVDGPATSTALNYLFGGAYDRSRNALFVSSANDLLRLDLTTDIITRVAGNGVLLGSIDGPGGDLRDDLVEGGDPFNTYVGFPAELAVSPAGDVVFFDRNTCRIRGLDVVQGRLYAVAGNGICGAAGDGSSAQLASVSYGQMAFDAAGNLFLADIINARVRRIDAATGIIDTVAGDGTFGVPVTGAAARSATGAPVGLAFDAQGHLVVAAGMHLIRISPGSADALVDGDADEVITVLGGCNTNCQQPFNGDGLPISHPQVYLPVMGHLTVAQDGAVIFADAFRVRRIGPGADGLVTGAADDIISTVGGYYDWETLSEIPNFNGDTFSTQSRFGGFLAVVDDAQGGIIVVDGNNHRVRRFGLPPAGPSAVSIQTVGLPGAVEGGAYSAAMTAAGGTGSGYAWSIDAGVLPDGLVLAPGGTPGTAISGTPTAAGTFDFTIRVTDSGGGTATRSFTIVVGDRVTIQTAALPDAVEGNAYTATLTAAGGTGLGYAWSISSGALPAGLVLAATGTPATTISGTPAEDGTFAFTVEVIDSGGNRATRGLTLVVVSSVVEITVIENILVTDAVALRPSAVIAVTEQIVVHDAPVLLPSAMIGVVEEIRVSDQPAIAADSIAPVLTLPSPIVAEAQTPGGAVVTFSVSASDDRPGAVSVLCTPASGTLFPFTGSSPTATTVTCTATDASGNVASATFSVTVQDTTAPQVLGAQLTVAATEPAGARGNVPQAPHTPLLQQIPLLAAALDAADPSPARVSVQWVACGNPAQVLGPVADTTLYPVGVNCFAYVFRDASGNVGSGNGTIEVAPPVGGPILAANVPVQATDLNNVALPVTATFLALDQPGLLTAVPPPFAWPPPAGFTFVGPPLEIRSTALAPAAVIACMRPAAGEFPERLFLLENGQWIDRTHTSSPATGEICGHPGPVGTFALARPDLPPLSLTITPETATRDYLQGHVVDVQAADQSNPNGRVVVRASVPLTVEFRDPLAPNAPLSIAPQFDGAGAFSGLVVSLATNANGQLTSTARQVADALTAVAVHQPGYPGLSGVETWPGTAGAGIVAPSAPRRLVRLFVQHRALTGSPPLYVSLPGRVLMALTGGSVNTTESILAHLDADDDGVADAGELVATAEVTWADMTPPVLTLPGLIEVTATSAAGATVDYVVTAVDAVSGPLTPSCTVPSGATFPVGLTLVTCTATDAAGNEGTGTFTVQVNAPPPPAPSPSLQLPGNLTVAATSAAGTVVTYTANATVIAFATSFTFPATCTPPSGSTFPVGTTTVSCTAANPFAPPPLSLPATGSFTVTVLPYVPPSVQLVATATYTKDGAGRWIATITIRNAGNATANGVQVTTARLNSASGVPLPLSFGSIAPNAVASGQVVFPAAAGTSGPANVLRVTLAWAGGSASLSQRALLP